MCVNHGVHRRRFPEHRRTTDGAHRMPAVGLVLPSEISSFGKALAGLAHPVAYFLMGVLTIGLAVLRSGLVTPLFF